MKIAIIGTGISGMGAAWLLNPGHDITIYEPNAYIGGHSRTVDFRDADGSIVPVDTGFIVYNEKNYPHLTGLFRTLDVPTISSDMSFGASIADGWLEYGSKGLFAQKRNLVRPEFYGMLRDVIRFNRGALGFMKGRGDISLRECLDGMGLGDWFRRYYLQAMGAAIWSCSVESILDFPASSFLHFFENHGLLTVNGHPQWRTVKGGSKEYVRRLTAPFQDKILLRCAARSVVRGDAGVTVDDANGGSRIFDHVVMACHADQALQLLKNPSDTERQVLGAFRYQENTAITHGDASFMPKHKACWSSWVYLSEAARDGNEVISLSYWMNRLQSLETQNPVIVTLNPGRRPTEHLIQDEHVFHHPLFDRAAVSAQSRIPEIQGAGNVWHCGAYQRYGFHEDGLMSAVAVAAKLGSPPPWV